MTLTINTMQKKPEEILKIARENKHWTQTDMAVKLGVSMRQYQKYEQGLFPKYKGEVVKTIDELLGTSLYAIIYEQSVPHEKQVDFIAHTDKDLYLIETKDFHKERLAKKNNSGPQLVPLVPVAAQAGYAKNFYDMAYIEKLETYPIVPGIDPHGAIWRYFQVKGKSMEDTFREGQFLLTSQVLKEDWRNIENFYVYVIVTDDGVVVKRLAKVKGKDYWAAISDNEAEYDQFKLPVADVKELWKYRRHIEWDASPSKKFEIKV